MAWDTCSILETDCKIPGRTDLDMISLVLGLWDRTRWRLYFLSHLSYMIVRSCDYFLIQYHINAITCSAWFVNLFTFLLLILSLSSLSALWWLCLSVFVVHPFFSLKGNLFHIIVFFSEHDLVNNNFLQLHIQSRCFYSWVFKNTSMNWCFLFLLLLYILRRVKGWTRSPWPDWRRFGRGPKKTKAWAIAGHEVLLLTHKGAGWFSEHWCTWAWNTDHAINVWIVGGFSENHLSRN